MATPTYYSNTPFQNAYDYIDQARQYALPSPQSLDTASARVRSRVDNAANTQSQAINEQYVGSGLGVSGMRNAAQGANNAARLSSLGTGLADVQDDYWKQLQTGAATLGNLGQQYGGIASQQGDLGVKEGLGLGEQGLKGRELDITANTAAMNDATARARLEEEHRQSIANNLIELFTATNQYGNTQLSTGSASIIDQIRQALSSQLFGAAH